MLDPQKAAQRVDEYFEGLMKSLPDDVDQETAASIREQWDEAHARVTQGALAQVFDGAQYIRT